MSTPKFESALFFFFGDLGKFDPASGGNGSGWVLENVQDGYSMGQLLTWLLSVRFESMSQVYVVSICHKRMSLEYVLERTAFVPRLAGSNLVKSQINRTSAGQIWGWSAQASAFSRSFLAVLLVVHPQLD